MAKKRANGEGSIRKKPSGRWEGRYTQGIDPVTGRAIQKSVSAKTQAECKEKLNRAIRDNSVPKSRPGGIQIDRKRLKKLQEKRIAMGHKPDDHEQQWPDMTM